MDIRKQIKLDLISMKPYMTFKNFAVMTFIAFLYMYIMKSPVITISMAMLFGIIFSSYPFLLGDNSGIDGLYRIYGIGSRELVIARYILAGIIFVLVSIFGIFYYLLIAVYKDWPIGPDVFFMIGVNFIFFALMVSFQYPIYFKYGYTKAKTFGLIPIYVIGILGMAIGFFKDYLMDFFLILLGHKEIMVLGLIGIVLIAIFLSIKLSIKFYKKRDF